MCNETGCKVLNSKGEVVTDLDPMDDEATLQLGDFTENRKDNLNGLVKINETSGKKIKLFQNFEVKDGKITSGKEELLTLLNRLRILGQYCSDYNDLVDRIELLGEGYEIDGGIHGDEEFIYTITVNNNSCILKCEEYPDELIVYEKKYGKSKYNKEEILKIYKIFEEHGIIRNDLCFDPEHFIETVVIEQLNREENNG